MKKRVATILGMLVCGATLATATAEKWRFAYAPFTGSFSIYGGGLGDPVKPSRTSKNIAFEVRGTVARQMFDAIGPDLKDVCGAEDGQRVRQRSEIVCLAHVKEGYRCSFGFNLITGRSIGGSIC